MKYSFSAFRLDTERLELSGPDGAIALQPQAFALLVFLIENSDRVVSKDEIFDAVWQGRIVGDGTLNARINAIRTAVGDDGTRQEVIRTMPRQGFRFVGELAEVAVDPSPTISHMPVKSVGILPFTDIGNDPEQAYFADGLTEDMITDLSKVRDLFVIARNTAFSYKGSSKSTVDIGREMGVAHVLEGSVRRAGGRIRINAQLVATESGGTVWAERYDRDFSDIFAVQDDITAEITKALKTNLSEGGERHNRGGSAEAYELCLRARSLFFKFTPEGSNECVALLEKAVGIDPDYSRAWAEQVFPWQSGHTFGFPGFEDGLRTAVQKGSRAVELDPKSGFAQARLGWALVMDSQHDASMDHFGRAVELEPNNADVYSWYCEALNFADEPELAIDAAETCLHYDPIAPANVLHHLAHSKFILGQYAEAIELENRVARIMPSFPPGRIIACAALVESGQLEHAKEHVQDMLSLNPNADLAHFKERYPYKNPDTKQRVVDALIKAGLT